MGRAADSTNRAGAIAVVVSWLLLPTLWAGQDAADPREVDSELTAEDEERLATLDARGFEHYRAGRFKEVLEDTQEATRIRERAFGKDDWRARANRRFEATIRRILKLPPAGQAEVVESVRAFEEAERLVAEGHFQQAEARYRRSYELVCGAIGERDRSAARILGALANLLRDHLQRFEEAERLERKALAILADQLGEHRDTAKACNALGNTLLAQGRLREADAYVRKGLQMRLATLGPEHAETERSFHDLAEILLQLGRYDEAEAFARKSLDLCLRVLGQGGEPAGYAYATLATCLHGSQEYAQAETHGRMAVEILSRHLGSTHRIVAKCRSNVAVCLIEQGELAEAEELLRKSVSILLRPGQARGPTLAHALVELATLLDFRGRHAETEKLYRESVSILLENLGEKHPEVLYGWSKLADVLMRNGDLEGAESILRNLVSQSSLVHGDTHPRTGRYRRKLASVLYRRGKLTEAERVISGILETLSNQQGARHVIAQCLFLLGSIRESQERYEEACRLHARGLKRLVALTGKGGVFIGKHLGSLAFCLDAQGKHDLALRAWKYAAESQEVTRQQSSLSGLERAGFQRSFAPLESLAECLARSAQPSSAWQTLEKHLARGLLDELAARSRLLTEGERRRESALLRRLVESEELIRLALGREPDESEIEELRARRNLLEAQLLELRRELVQRHGPLAGATLELESIQAALRPDQAIIAWVEPPLRDHSPGCPVQQWAFLLRHQGRPRCVALPGSGRNGAWTRVDVELPGRLRDAILRPEQVGAGTWREVAARLRSQRLVPLERFLGSNGDLPEARHIVVIPSGGMLGVPVEVITDRYVVSYAPSGTLYAMLSAVTDAGSRTGKFLGVADPVLPEEPEPPPGQSTEIPLLSTVCRKHYGPLPGTRREVREIAKLFQKTPGNEDSERVRLILGEDASDRKLSELALSGELNRFEYIHFATHAEVDDLHHLGASLVLGADFGEDAGGGWGFSDGRLTASEILRTWKLDAELVTLSACRTALGQRAGGDGYVGFTQVLLATGARSVLLSLWDVPDDATMLLMHRFYGNLIRDGASKAEALGEAKVWLRELSRTDRDNTLAALSETGETNREPTRGLRIVSEERSRGPHPYAHPYYWAGFILLGSSSRNASAAPAR